MTVAEAEKRANGAPETLLTNAVWDTHQLDGIFRKGNEMAHDLNRCEFIGRLGRDPEIRYMPAGDAVANFQIAVSKAWKDKTGVAHEETTWVPIVAFAKLAEIIGEYCKKGSQVYVAGEFHVRKYQDKEGNDRWITEVRIDRMQMLGGKKPDESTDDPAPKPATTKKDYAEASGKKRATEPAGQIDSDIPF